MNAITKAILLSLLPISELRGGIPFALASGINPLLSYLLCSFANLLVIPIFFFFLDYINKYFMKLRPYRILFEKKLNHSKRKIEKKIGTKWQYFALMFFVAIPLPVTGAYTGTLLAWFFRLDRRKSYLSLFLGVFIAGLITLFVSLAGITFFRFLIS